MDPEVKRQLDLRLAKGEITREEYSDTLKALTEGDKSAGGSSVFSKASGAFNVWLNKGSDPYGEYSYKNVEPTDEVPLIVNDELSLFGATLKLRQTTLRYSDIRSLGFDAIRQTVNFTSLTRYYASLYILPPSGEWIKVFGEWKPKAFGRSPSVIKVKLVENACYFLAPLTFQQRMQRRLDEMVRNGYTDISKSKGKPEVRLFRDGFIEKERVRIIAIRTAGDFHDRFIIRDSKDCFHLGHSIKDFGSKACMLTQIQDAHNCEALKTQFEKSWQSATPFNF